MMKKINKILITIVFTLACWLLFCFADDLSDCGYMASNMFHDTNKSDWFDIVNTIRWENDKYTKFLSRTQKDSIIDSGSLNTAMLNLKKYCCDHDLIDQNLDTCKNDKNFFNPNVIDSPYLFSHLFDVIMRRLNWLTWNTDIYTWIEMKVDDKWKERRDWISNKATDLSWSDVQSILDEYNKFWKPNTENWTDYYIATNVHSVFWKYDTQDFLNYIWWSGNDESKHISESLQQYENWSLYDRYNNACALTEIFYSLLTYPRENSSPTDKHKTWSIIGSWVCQNAVKSKINLENAYVSSIIKESSNLLLENNINKYLWYLQNRMDKLKITRKNSADRFYSVTKNVPQLIDKCTH